MLTPGSVKTHRTRHIIMLTAKIYYRVKGHKAKPAKGKGHGAKSRRNQEHPSKSPPHKESHRMHLISPALNCDNTCKVLSTREAP